MATRPVTSPRRAAARRGPEPPAPSVTGGGCGGGGAGCSASALLGFAVVAGGLYYLSRIPLPSPRPLKQTTFVYDSTGKHVLASFSEQNRVNVSLEQVPQVVINAVVSTEDRHFFTEGALNPVSIVRAFISDIRGTGTLQGASTITQQYVKQTYLVLAAQRSIPQDQGGGARHPGGPLRVQAGDPAELSQHHLLGARRLRGGSRLPGLLRQERQPAGPARGIAAGRA